MRRTTKHACCSSTDHGGGERRHGVSHIILCSCRRALNQRQCRCHSQSSQKGSVIRDKRRDYQYIHS
jgi:hypothetical protein